MTHGVSPTRVCIDKKSQRCHSELVSMEHSFFIIICKSHLVVVVSQQRRRVTVCSGYFRIRNIGSFRDRLRYLGILIKGYWINRNFGI